ncbi:MAG: biopolymer transporter ExbD [Muribaculaceae bacterium]|nr:biopolymer transporter ExbD [Muribaculaceae bacterium]
MGKIKVKRKSTLIDMTAMSDVTVLLLTFFMLTSTFLQKEPTQVITPPSVSTTKVETSNVAQILVSTDPTGENTKVYISLLGEADPDFPEANEELGLYPGMWSTEELRKSVLTTASLRYKELTGRDPGITKFDVDKFAKIGTFGVPMMQMHEFLNMDQTAQDEFISNLANPQSGIPLRDIKKADGTITNEFQIWMIAIRDAGNPGLTEAMRKTGSGIAVKADRTAQFNKVNEVLENLRTIKLNKFTVMTALKTEND